MRHFLSLLLIVVNFSCAQKKADDPYVRCQVILEFDESYQRKLDSQSESESQNESGKQIAYWDMDRGQKVDVSTCDEIHPTGENHPIN